MSRQRLLRLHGHHAVRAVLDRRPGSVQRLFLSKAQSKRLGPMLQQMAKDRRTYRVVAEDELKTLAKSPHHEGLVADVDPAPSPSDERVFGGGGPVLALDRVENPNNLGAVCRSCAHFGASLLAGPGPSQLQGAAARVAQGGAEVVAYRSVDRWGPVFDEARRRGYVCWALAGEAEQDLFEMEIPKRVLWLVGNERDGASPEALQSADAVLRLGGTGQVESLNASVAAAVALTLHRRAHS